MQYDTIITRENVTGKKVNKYVETKTVEVVKTVSLKSTLFLRFFCRKIKKAKNFVLSQNPKRATFKTQYLYSQNSLFLEPELHAPKTFSRFILSRKKGIKIFVFLKNHGLNLATFKNRYVYSQKDFF